MTDNIMLIASFVGGVTLGVFFFGGLWWTIKRGLMSEWSAVWFIGSLILRTGVVLSGFYLVSQGHWRRLAVSLLGFVIARFVILARFKRLPEDAERRLELEAPRAPQS